MRYRVPGSTIRKIDAVQRWWGTLTLEKQFAFAAAIVLLVGMASIGWWVASRVSRAVIENSAAAAALYIDSSVAPLVQELAESDVLKPATLAELDELMAQTAIAERIVTMNIWRLDGTIVYSQEKGMIGRTFPPERGFSRAAAGELAAELDETPDEHDRHVRATTDSLLEVYAPVRETHSRRVIAVSEIYTNGEILRTHVWREVASSWLIVGHVAFFMVAALWGIVVGGSRIIGEQRLQLRAQIGELQTLLTQNEDLRVRLQRSNTKAAAANERFLRRIGSDLHDGPAQLLSYSLLRLHRFVPLVERDGNEKERRELSLIRDALSDTLREVRNISEGMALPELDPISLKDTIELAIASHERLTHTRVSRNLGVLVADAPQSLKICAYRFVQEGLTNAFRHAGGNEQGVTAQGTQSLEITVSDGGPGLAIDNLRAGGLGLVGLRARIEAIGGYLEMRSAKGEGTRLAARFDLDKMRHKEEDIDA